MLKTIFIYVIVLVVAMLIFSAITDPSMKYKIKSAFSSVKGKLVSDINKIPTPEKTSCEKKAKELIPDYLVISSTGYTQVGNKFKDGLNIRIGRETWGGVEMEHMGAIIRGSSQGQNINHFYMVKSIVYSKKIINEDGLVLGTRQFEFLPILKLSDTNLDIELIGDGTTFRGVSWSGFSDDIKDILNKESITFKVERVTLQEDYAVIDEFYTQEKGEFDSDIEFVIDKGSMAKTYWTKDIYFGDPRYRLQISPNILDNKIYEFVDYNFQSCNWIDDIE